MQSEMGVSAAIPPCQVGSQSALASWLLEWFSGASGEEREMMIQATYGLWLATVVAHLQEWRVVHPVQQ